MYEMKSAYVGRIQRIYIVAVFINGQQVESNTFNSQTDAIDWLEEYHFDCQSLRIETH